MQTRFPFPPYQCQIQFANQLYSALIKKTKLCIMQSPTGTGKTYSLLVAAIKFIEENQWQKQYYIQTCEDEQDQENWAFKNQQDSIIIGILKRQKLRQQTLYQKIQNGTSNIFKQNNFLQNNRKKISQLSWDRLIPKIKLIYCSRTYSQLEQVHQSLKKINTNLKVLYYSGKNLLCINSQIKIQKQMQIACYSIITDNPNNKIRCPYYLDKFEYKDLKINMQYFNKTMEQSIEIGKSCGRCPFYSLKSIIQFADILLMPYSCIINQSIQNKLEIQLKNSIIIFDQGHNIVQFDIQIHQNQLKYKQLCQCLEHLNFYLNKYKDKMQNGNIYLINSICLCINKLLDYIKRNKQEVSDYKTMDFVDFLMEVNLSQFCISQVSDYINKNNFCNKIFYIKSNEQKQKQQNINFSLKKIISFIETLFIQNSIDDWCVIFKKQLFLTQCSIKVFPFSPQRIDQIIEKSLCTILTGGTMQPLQQLKEIKKKFQRKTKICSFNHIIQKWKCQVFIVDRFKGVPICMKKSNRGDQINKQCLKQLITITHLLNQEGTLFFVPSYQYLYQLKLQFFDLIPNILFDSKQKNKTFQKYSNIISKQQKATLFTVVGGSLSEGVNFENGKCRILVIVGVPYAFKSPQIQLRIMKNGTEFYEDQCMRNVNQTIGRAIRHKDDYSIIILLDFRYKVLQEKLSGWLRERTEIIFFQQLQNSINNFFQNIK